MFIKQLSIFIENREGRLEKVTETLAENDINIICISLADTSEYGLLRMIVSDPDKAKDILKKNGFSAVITEVIAVKIPHNFGTLHTLTKELCKKDLNIEYMYAFTSGKDNASIIIKSNNNESALEVINNMNYETLSPEYAYNL